ncbi:ferredoxin reductase family protein [Yinghuangia seranimata]|uniref:ferredoxin reductase family protein n=1 Tax=Yinghuangia seranimata TaxID=408067 RepID=UPI00248BFC29|nr:ferredoxin reductase family protein [Yinghuangia seranimata]MDI2125033.1 ferredoxin reductase family protein [Yinghuangia seranimata]
MSPTTTPGEPPHASHAGVGGGTGTSAPPRVTPAALYVGVATGGGTVVGLWAAQARWSIRADALLATAAHLAGLLAGYGFLVMLLLMARVPAIERGVGADVLTRRHTQAARYVLSALGAHLVLALAGYAVHTGKDPVSAFVSLLRYPALAAATVGTVLVLAAGYTSATRVRRRLQHEAWRGVHLMTYVGAALGFFHQPAGPDLAGVPVLAWLWSLLHAQLAMLLVWYRGAVPARQALRHRLRVAEVRVESPDVVSITMRGRDLALLQAEPGQFLRWRFLTRRLWRTALPFSLSAPVAGDELRITVKAVGGHTRRIRRLRPGVRVVATGPFGALTAHRRMNRKVLLLAGGIGVTPMRALFETLPARPGELTLLYRASTREQVVLADELRTIALRRQARVYFLLGPSRGPGDPLHPAALLRLVPDLPDHDVYLCGSPGMAGAAERSLLRAGVPHDRIHAEMF